MKTKQLWAGLLLVSTFFTVRAQNVASTTTLTSGGNAASSIGSGGTYYGYMAGNSMTPSGLSNTLIGNSTGKSITTGKSNVFLGYNSGPNANTGNGNIFVGANTGINITNGSGNVYLGNNTGSYGNGSNNTYLGNNTGISSTGSNNVFIGSTAGYLVKEDNILVIDNIGTSKDQFIWGDFANDLLKFNAKVGIGGVTTFPTTAGGVDLSTYKLFIKGGILAHEVRVTTNWADYVFADNYVLPTLSEVECFIAENGHLPNVPSAKQVEAEGISVGEMAKIQQEKIEELTLYIIQQDKELKEQNKKIEKLEQQEKELNDLKVLVHSLIDKK